MGISLNGPGRRAFLGVMGGVAGTLLAAVPAAAAAPRRHILLVRVRLPEDSRMRGPQPFAAGPFGDLARSGTGFANAFAASSAPLARELVVRTGYHAHQLGAWGLVHDLAKIAPPPASARPVGERLADIGYAAATADAGSAADVLRAASNRGMPVFVDLAIDFASDGAPVGAQAAHAVGSFADTANALVILVADIAGQEELPIPLTIRVPGRAGAGQVRDALVSNVDLVPTMLDWAGIPDLAMPGSSLLPLIARPRAARRTAVFASQGFATIARYEPRRSIQTDRYLYVRRLGVPAGGPDFPAEQLFDTRADPADRQNLAGRRDYREQLGSLRRQLAEWRAATGDHWLG